MDANKRARIEVLIPILEAVEDEVHGVFVQEEDESQDTFEALNVAWDHITVAVEELKKIIELDQPTN
jgi:hypothetical protein